MKIRERNEVLRCSACNEDVKAVVDAPQKGNRPWGYWCKDCVGIFAIAHWRDSTITTMLVRTKADAF